ncbi:uncharacterized protein IWZ02DRAFT_55260 [Phyllosticta citriasiana]|uniref:uncharacterized protein n=1 Tax=Phyllosticta citriasiana TaxID=595635 RepID=UPI0030FD48A5
MVRGALLASLPQEQPFCTSQSASRAAPPFAYQSAHRPPPPKQSLRGCSTDWYPRSSCRRRASTVTRRRRIQPRTISTTHHCFLASAPSCRNTDDDQVSMRTTDATRNAHPLAVKQFSKYLGRSGNSRMYRRHVDVCRVFGEAAAAPGRRPRSASAACPMRQFLRPHATVEAGQRTGRNPSLGLGTARVRYPRCGSSTSTSTSTSTFPYRRYLLAYCTPSFLGTLLPSFNGSAPVVYCCCCCCCTLYVCS